MSFFYLLTFPFVSPFLYNPLQTLQVRHWLEGFTVRKYLMTWVGARKGWMKEYRGKKYAVSAAQLGMPPTKDQSWLAANQWWERKQAQIDAANQPATVGTVLDQVAAVLGVKDLPPELAAQILTLRGQPSQTSVTISQARDQWLAGLLMSVNARLIDISRYDAYRRYVVKFVTWCGGEKDIRTIDNRRLEEWWAHLGVQIAEGAMKPATAHQALMTSKQFLTDCIRKNLMAPISSLTDKRLRIKIPIRAVETLSVEEVRRLFSCDGSERSKLFVLLMLNCGMLQSDISDLGESEVDWNKGILTRPRSKKSEGMVSRYMLWDDTFALLKKYRAKEKVANKRGDYRVLLTERNTPLVAFRQEGNKMRRKDNIRTTYRSLAAQAKIDKPIKYLRKTSASLLGSHTKYKYYADYFLSHTPKTVAARHYVVPNDFEFFEALAWLEEQLFCQG